MRFPTLFPVRSFLLGQWSLRRGQRVPGALLCFRIGRSDDRIVPTYAPTYAAARHKLCSGFS